MREVNDDWRAYRPAIWLAMLGVAVLLVISPAVGVVLVGAGIGTGVRIASRRRRLGRSGRPPATRRR